MEAWPQWRVRTKDGKVDRAGWLPGTVYQGQFPDTAEVLQRTANALDRALGLLRDHDNDPAVRLFLSELDLP